MDPLFQHHCHAAESDDDCLKLFKTCSNEQRHDEYVPVPEFKRKYLDPLCDIFTDMEKKYMESWIDCTVRIIVTFVSSLRPDTFAACDIPYPFHEHKAGDVRRCGTGCLWESVQKAKDGKECPCPECKISKDPKKTFWYVAVSTSTHLVFDKLEAQTAVIEFFFDSKDRKGVKYVYGFDVASDSYTRYFCDLCVLICVTHDPDLADQLTKIMMKKDLRTFLYYKRNYTPGKTKDILVSHPHGISKMVSIGTTDALRDAFCSLNLLPILLNKDINLEINCGQTRSREKKSDEIDTTDNYIYYVRRINETYFPPCVDYCLNELSGYDFDSKKNSFAHREICDFLDKVSIEYDKNSLFFIMPASIIGILPLNNTVLSHYNSNQEFSFTMSSGITFVSSTGNIHRTTTELQFRARYDESNAPNFLPHFLPRIDYTMIACVGSSGAMVCPSESFYNKQKQEDYPVIGTHLGYSPSHNIGQSGIIVTNDVPERQNQFFRDRMESTTPIDLVKELTGEEDEVVCLFNSGPHTISFLKSLQNQPLDFSIDTHAIYSDGQKFPTTLYLLRLINLYE